MPEGALEGLALTPGEPAGATLLLTRSEGPEEASTETLPEALTEGLALEPLLGQGLRIEFSGRRRCSHCRCLTAASFGRGYCRGCFRRLARCDLCVVSPDRCHYAAGTCREPEWGRAYCMQPHVVYLASSGAAKVGLTRADGEVQRWLAQGAEQGLVIARASTRRLAGVLEKRLAQHVSERSDWRRLVRGPAPVIDLTALRDRLMAAVTLPPGIDWLPDQPERRLRFPVLHYPRQAVRLRPEPASGSVVAGQLLGVKGPYLLFAHGVLSVQEHRGHEVRISTAAPEEVAESPPTLNQLELFSA